MPQTKERKTTEYQFLIASVGEAHTLYQSPYFPDSYSFPWNPDPLARGNNYNIYEEMRDDDQVKVALSFKKDLVVNSGWQIVCDMETIKEFITNNLKQLEEGGALDVSFEDALRDILNSYDFGFTITEPVYKIVGAHYELSKLKVRPPQSFRFVIDPRGEVLSITQAGNLGDIVIDPRRVLHHVYQQEFGNPYGKSDLRATHTAWKAKKFISKFLAIFLERYAGATVVGKFPATYDTNEITAFHELLKKIQQTTALAIPSDVDFEFVQAQKDSSDIYIKALNYYNMHIARSLLVPDLMGIGGSETGGGSYSLGKEQFKLFLSTIQKDRDSLARKITLRLIKPLVLANFGDYKCEFKFLPYDVDDEVELLKLWSDVVKGRVFKPTPEEINYLRRQLKFPEGPVELIEEQPQMSSTPMPPQRSKAANGVAPFVIFRALTSYEKNLDFKQIEEKLDKGEEKITARLRAAARTIWSDHIQRVKESGLIRGFRPERLTTLQPRFLRDMNRVFKAYFTELAEDAYGEARQEMFPKAPRQVKFGLEEGELNLEDMLRVLETESFKLVENYRGLYEKRLNSTIVKGLKEGLTESDIVDQLKELMPDLTDKWLDTIVRTKTTDIYNRGRKSYYDNDPLAQQVIEAYQYSAILDDRTSEVCRYLDGKIFAKGEFVNKVVPPLHFNCRSVLVPVSKFEDYEVDDEPSLDSLIEKGGGLINA